MTRPQCDAYLAAAVDFAGSFQCRDAAPGNGIAKRYRLAFVSRDRQRLERIAELIGVEGSIYADSARTTTQRLEYYRWETIAEVISRVRELVGPTKRTQIEEFESHAGIE